ncbi:hypothetical protein Bbelb_052770 [Branchiostoma belcheri]|nr:hypothetical protein Bbelb_052770 [Branchiostoma belcheri]
MLLQFQNKALGDPNSRHFFLTTRAIYQPKFVTLACPEHEISKPEVQLHPGGQFVQVVLGGSEERLDSMTFKMSTIAAAQPDCKSRSTPYRTPHGSRRETDRASDRSLTETGRQRNQKNSLLFGRYWDYLCEDGYHTSTMTIGVSHQSGQAGANLNAASSPVDVDDWYYYSVKEVRTSGRSVVIG